MSVDPGQDLRPGPKGPGGPPGPVDRTGRRALWLGLLSLVLLFIPLLGYLVAIPAIAAIVLGVRARRSARRNQGTAPGALPGIVLGSIGLVLFVAAVAVQIVLYSELQQYSKCRSAANTITAETRCKDQLAREIEDRLGLPDGTLKGSSLPF